MLALVKFYSAFRFIVMHFYSNNSLVVYSSIDFYFEIF
jgi:hypothetical protein